MSDHHENTLATHGGLPREAAVGILGSEATIDEVVATLDAAGVAADQLYFLHGEEGASLLESGGSALSRLMEGEVRNAPVAAIRSGRTAVAVMGVAGDDVEIVRTALSSAGVENQHYFGRWTRS